MCTLFIALKVTFYKGLQTWCCFTYYVGYIEKVFKCTKCGKLIKIKSKTKIPIYCDNCAIKIDRNKAKERMKILRN